MTVNKKYTKRKEKREREKYPKMFAPLGKVSLVVVMSMTHYLSMSPPQAIFSKPFIGPEIT